MFDYVRTMHMKVTNSKNSPCSDKICVGGIQVGVMHIKSIIFMQDCPNSEAHGASNLYFGFSYICRYYKPTLIITPCKGKRFLDPLHLPLYFASKVVISCVLTLSIYYNWSYEYDKQKSDNFQQELSRRS
jgi:hypothetical protein